MTFLCLLLAAAYIAPATLTTTAAAQQAVQLPRSAVGSCLVNLQASSQCGGNMTNALLQCSMFNSCFNTSWAGACCPAGSTCTQLTGQDICWTCGGTVPQYLNTVQPTVEQNMCSTMPNGDYDYPCVLGAAMLFYEAQRSGSLPANNRIKWRGNSGLYDVAPNNQSLAGGW